MIAYNADVANGADRTRMRLRFNPEVRRTIAAELRKVSTFGGIGVGVLGYSSNAPVILLGAFLWWIMCQTIAAMLLAMEDDE